MHITIFLLAVIVGDFLHGEGFRVLGYGLILIAATETAYRLWQDRKRVKRPHKNSEN
ncbi:MAG: hypothetical protein RIB80_04760 [Rhodospirillales bacterium]